jgi:cytosine deaminase
MDAPFDRWSESLCRADWLRSGPAALPLQPGSAADLIIFKDASPWSFPSRTHERVVLRQGQAVKKKESTL